MSRLESRPNYDADIAARLQRRCREVHTQQWRADVHRGEEVIAEDLPIVGGSLTLDSSDPIRRHLTLEIGGGEKWAPRNQDSPLVPFGQRITLWTRVDEADGHGWFPWLKMGEYQIATSSFERPAFITTVECHDMSGAVNEYLIRDKRSFVDMTVHNAIKTLTEEAVPGFVFAIDSSDFAKDPDRALKNYVADSGVGRWDAVTEIAARRGHEAFFDALGNLIIRRDVTDDNDESIPGNGPDIGTVSNPIAILTDGTNGNMIGLTSTLSREGACNGVQINLHSTVPRKVRKKQDRTPVDEGGTGGAACGEGTPESDTTEWKDAPINASVFESQTAGPVTWGGMFGRIPIVIERDVKDLKRWSNGGEETWSHLQADAHRDAKRILHRRRGVTRYLDIHALPLPWLECDDKVRVRWHEQDDAEINQEAHFVQRVEFDIGGGGPMVVRTRQLNTVDPGT